MAGPAAVTPRVEPLEGPGEPIVCATCGESKWAAEYFEAVRQDVRLVRDADGGVRVDAWLGGVERHHDRRTSEECYRCLDCGEEIPAGTENNNHPTLLLRTIARVINDRSPSPVARAAIANALRAGGFEVLDADEDGRA